MCLGCDGFSGRFQIVVTFSHTTPCCNALTMLFCIPLSMELLEFFFWPFSLIPLLIKMLFVLKTHLLMAAKKYPTLKED